MSKENAALDFGCFRLSSAEREALQKQRNCSEDDLLRHLVKQVKEFALVPVSDFRVGCAGISASGEVYLGVNLEFAGASFAQTVHAEQFLVSLSRTYSRSPLVKLAVSAAPCGHCRQFVAEFDPEGRVELLIGEEPAVTLKHLLPRAFTPADLKVIEPFYSQPLELDEQIDLEAAARAAASVSYVPYSGTRAGTALKLKDGRLFAGSAIENVAYNPALPPLQAAVVSAFAEGASLDDITDVVLCQERGGQIDYEPQLRDLAASLNDNSVDFRTIFL